MKPAPAKDFCSTLIHSIWARKQTREPMEYPNHFGSNIAVLLKHSGLTNDQLAARLGTMPYQITYTSLKDNPRAEMLESLRTVAIDYSLHRLAAWFENRSIIIARTKRNKFTRREPD